MKKIFTFLISILIFIIIIDEKIFNDSIYNIVSNSINNTTYKLVKNIDALTTSSYLNKDYSSYVKSTTNFTPRNKQELLNIYYTILNNGWDNFSYYCDDSYTNCLDDIKSLTKTADTFSQINQLVHPYNSFSTIKSNYNEDGRIDVSIKKKYSEDDIIKINNKIDNIINELNINKYNSVEEKIKVFHDYLANTNKYDSNKLNKTSIYNSDTAIGTLFEGYSICSGYTDTLAIFLSKLGIDNVRVANNDHTWNALLLDNKWKHIDLTWDDPILDNGEDTIIYDYFLISSSNLNSLNDNGHFYSINIYDFIK